MSRPLAYRERSAFAEDARQILQVLQRGTTAALSSLVRSSAGSTTTTSSPHDGRARADCLARGYRPRQGQSPAVGSTGTRQVLPVSQIPSVLPGASLST